MIRGSEKSDTNTINKLNNDILLYRGVVLYDLEDKKKIAIIASIFIWAYNNIFIKFYVDDFWLLYNSQNFENKIDNLISVINNAMKNMYNKEVLNDTIKIINSIFQK